MEGGWGARIMHLLNVAGGTIINSRLASLDTSPGFVTISSLSSFAQPKSILPSVIEDSGPYCFFNSTTSTIATSYFVSSGFVVTDSFCSTNCNFPGCTKFRLVSYSPLAYSSLSRCRVAEAFHYSAAGSEKEVWCPWYDLKKSVFSFKGRTYNIQWYWLGWGTESDCMGAVLCGPSSMFFDPSQSETLAWCQPVPFGYFSQECSNSVNACVVPEIAGGSMALAFWTSHGYGSPGGCGMRLVCAAVQGGLTLSQIFTSSWSLTFSLKVLSKFTVGSSDVLFGSLASFAVGIVMVSQSSVQLKFFHSLWTVTPSSCWISTGAVSWFPQEMKSVVLSFSNQLLSVYANNVLISQLRVSTSTASLGKLTTVDFARILTPDTIHYGTVFASRVDFSASTTSAFPYDVSGGGIDFSISDSIGISPQAFTTSTIAPSSTFEIPSVLMTSVSHATSSRAVLTYTSTLSTPFTSSPSPSTDPASTFLVIPFIFSTQNATMTTSWVASSPNLLSPGAIAGIIICVLVVVSAITFLLIKCKRARRRSSGAVYNSWQSGSWFEEPSLLPCPPIPATELAVDETYVFYF